MALRVSPPPDIADLQAVMRLIHDRLEQVLAAVPVRQKPRIANALLNLAVERMLAEQGAASTATILHRLSELIAGGTPPEGGEAYRLTRHDA